MHNHIIISIPLMLCALGCGSIGNPVNDSHLEDTGKKEIVFKTAEATPDYSHYGKAYAYANGDDADSFGLFAHLGPEPPYTADYAWNMKYERTDSGWTCADKLFWPGHSELHFHAYMPYESETDGWLHVSPANETPMLFYTSPSDVLQQVDILAASSAGLAASSPKTDGISAGIVELNFKHTLSGVSFKVGNEFADGAEVTRIRMSSIRNTGAYDIAEGSWSTEDGTGEIVLNGTGFKMHSGISAGDDISGVPVLFIPQAFSADSDAAIEISIDDGGQACIGKIPLAGHSFLAGFVYTYHVSYQGGRIRTSMTEPYRFGGSTSIDDDSIVRDGISF